MTLHTLLFFILVPIWAAVVLGKTILEYQKKRSYSKYLIQFIVAIVMLLAGILFR